MFEKICLTITTLTCLSVGLVIVLTAAGILKNADFTDACHKRCEAEYNWQYDIGMCLTACKDPEYAAKHR